MDGTETRDLLHRYGLRAKKSLGQHFLTDNRVLGKIIQAADLHPDDAVVEVGPGLGILTRALAERAGSVIAVELDASLASLLRERLSQHPNVFIVEGDILDLDPRELVSAHGTNQCHSVDGRPRYLVVANLPYYVASATVRHFLESSHRPQRMVVMVQKEVGQNMAAQPGAMGLLSLGVQVYGKPTIVARVPASHFYPRPKVDSVVVAIEVYPEPRTSDPQGFFRVVRAGFSAPRKQLHNTLALGLRLPVSSIREVLQQAGIDGRRRPGTLTIEEWDTLSRALP